MSIVSARDTRPARHRRTTPYVWVAALFSIVCLVVTTTPVRAEWSGTVKTRDGVELVLNPATAALPAVSKAAREEWRVGGDDDEDVLFGVISSIAVGSDGNVYLLDAQLSVIHVFTPDGEYVGEIGREGEGPGEFRRAEDLFLTSSGNIAVMQRMPGKIVQMTSDGDPLDNFPLPTAKDGSRFFIAGGTYAADQLLLQIREFSRQDNGFSITRKLIRLNNDGEVTASYRESTRERNMAAMEFDEKADAEEVFGAGNDGRVYIHDNWDAYEINVYGPDAKQERIISREFTPRKRTAEEIERNKPRIRMRGRGGEVKVKSTGAETDRNVRALYPRDDGSLWVVNGQVADAPEGVIANFDVFDSQGRFVQTVGIQCDGDFEEDGIHFVGDKLFIVKHLRAARQAMFGGAEEEDQKEEPEDIEPISVICYDIGDIVAAKL